jgi:arylsulfatase
MEVYAAYLAETDYEIGRVIKAVDDLGERDNTVIIHIQGDNGASAEGTFTRHPKRSPHSRQCCTDGRPGAR